MIQDTKMTIRFILELVGLNFMYENIFLRHKNPVIHKIL